MYLKPQMYGTAGAVGQQNIILDDKMTSPRRLGISDSPLECASCFTLCVNKK
jgi:hypothetical protein